MSKVKRTSYRGRCPDGSPNPIDVHVGQRIRLRRCNLGLSQEKFATLLGLTFQQVQKYESGSNRIGCSRLWDISQVLLVPVSYFFDEMDKDTINKSPRRLLNKGAKQEGELVVSNVVSDPLLDTKNMSIITAFQRIRNPQVAKHLFELIVSMSATVESALPKRKG